MTRSTASRRARNSASVMIGGRRRPARGPRGGAACAPRAGSIRGWRSPCHRPCRQRRSEPAPVRAAPLVVARATWTTVFPSSVGRRYRRPAVGGRPGGDVDAAGENCCSPCRPPRRHRCRCPGRRRCRRPRRGHCPRCRSRRPTRHRRCRRCRTRRRPAASPAATSAPAPATTATSASSSSASPSDALSPTAASVPASAIVAIGSSWSPEAAGTLGATRLRDARRGRVSSSSRAGATGGWKTRLGGWNVSAGIAGAAPAASTAGAAWRPTLLVSDWTAFVARLRRVRFGGGGGASMSDDAAGSVTDCLSDSLSGSVSGFASGATRMPRVGRPVGSLLGVAAAAQDRTVRPVGWLPRRRTELVMCRRAPVRSRRLARCRASGGSLPAPGRIAPRRSLCRTAVTGVRSSGSLS